MKNAVRIFGSALVLAIWWSPAHGQSGDRPEDTVRAFHEALARGDSAAVLSLLAEDAVIYESGGAEASREEYRSRHLPADIAFARATEKQVTVDLVDASGQIVWVLARSTTTGTFRGVEVDTRGTETVLLESTDDGWRIRHIHWSDRDASAAGGS